MVGQYRLEPRPSHVGVEKLGYGDEVAKAEKGCTLPLGWNERACVVQPMLPLVREDLRKVGTKVFLTPPQSIYEAEMLCLSSRGTDPN